MNLEDITRDIAADNIVLFATEGRLVQAKWQDTGNDGRRIACLLGSIHDGIDDPMKCPGAVMPNWLAECIPGLFDGISSAKVAEYGLKFASALRRGDMDDAVLRRFMTAVIIDAMFAADPGDAEITEWDQAKEACEKVLDLIRDGSGWDSCDLSNAEDAAYTAYVYSEHEQISQAARCAYRVASGYYDLAIDAASAVGGNRAEASERLFDALITAMLRGIA